MSILITSDLHLTSNKADEYRWGLFPWIHRLVNEHKVESVFILGDLTDLKDNHSAKLVNRIVDELQHLAFCLDGDLLVLKGNHDFIDPACPFFKFLDISDTGTLDFIVSPRDCYSALLGHFKFLPFTRNPQEDWKALDLSKYDWLFMHETMNGSIASSGIRLPGLDAKLLKKICAPDNIISGDIHVPQKVGNVEYVGSPYRIRFGDEFEPRCLLITESGVESLYPRLMKKHLVVVKDPEELEGFLEENDEYCEGDQMKVRLLLSKASYVHWSEYKKEVIDLLKAYGIEPGGIELHKQKNRVQLKDSKNKQAKIKMEQPKDILTRYCTKEKLVDTLKDLGHSML